MDTLVGIWIGCGLIVAMMALLTGESEGISMMIMCILLGPIMLLFLLFSFLLSSKDKPKKNHIAPSEKAPPSESESPKFLDKYIKLEILRLSKIFDDKTANLSRKNFVDLQNFSDRICKNIEEYNNLPKGEIIQLLQLGISNITPIYGNDTVGKKRRLSLIECIKKLDPDHTFDAEGSESDSVSIKASSKLNLPFDVTVLEDQFKGWKINKDFREQENNLLINGDQYIRVSDLKYNRYDNFNSKVEILKGHAREFAAKHFKQGINGKGFQYVAVETQDNSGVFNGAIHCQGPGFQYVYASYETTSSIFTQLLAVCNNFQWTPIITDKPPKVSTLKQLKLLVKKVLKGHENLEEMLEGINEDYFYISSDTLEDLAYEDPKYWGLIKVITNYVIKNNEDNEHTGLIISLLPFYTAAGINDVTVYEKLLTVATKQAETTEEFLELANAFATKKESNRYLNKAVTSATSWYDLENIVDNSQCDQKLWTKVEIAIRNNLDIPKLDDISNPFDVLLSAIEKKFIYENELVKQLEIMITKPLQSPLAILVSVTSYIESIKDEATKSFTAEFKRLQKNLLKKIQNEVTSDEDIFEVYNYFIDDLNDQVMAEKYKKKHNNIISKQLAQEEESEQTQQLILNICKCAILVSIADGSMSEEELDEIDAVSPYIKFFIDNEAAVKTLIKTFDIELAREKRVENDLVYDGSILLSKLFYVDEIAEEINSMSEGDNINKLVKKYASNIDDDYYRRIALWAATEVASIDGFHDSEKFMLEFFAKEWNIQIKENQKYFEQYVYPATNDNFAFEHPDEPSLKELSTKLDEDAKDQNSEEAEELRAVMEMLGVDSFEALTELVKEEDDIVEDTEAPPILDAIFSSGDWFEVIKTANDDADINATMNYKGIKGFSIMHLCAEQGDTDTLRTLIEKGGDLNVKIENLEFSCGYQDPLTASLKGDNQENFDLLIDLGAKTQPYKNKQSAWTPLNMAAAHENLTAIKTLIRHKVDTNIANADGSNAIHFLSFKESDIAFDCIKFLVEAGCDPLTRNNGGFASIHHAVTSSSLKLVKFLIEDAKVPIEYPIKGIQGQHLHTPLLRALGWGRGDVANYLIEKGASLKAKQKNKNALVAVFTGTLKHGLTESATWVKKYSDANVKITLNDIIECCELLAYEEDDSFNESIFMLFENLIKQIKITKTTLAKIDSDRVREILINAEDNCPESIKKVLILLNDKGVNLTKYG